MLRRVLLVLLAALPMDAKSLHWRRHVQDSRMPLEPGQSVIVNAELAYAGEGWPAGGGGGW